MAIALSKFVCSTLLATGFAVSLVAAPAHAKVNGKNNQTSTTSNPPASTTSNPPAQTTSNPPASTSSSVACSTNNVSLGGIFATACEGPFSDNDTGSGDLVGQLNNGLFDIGSGVKWELFGKSDGGAFFADDTTSNGALKLKQALTSNTFVISLKSSTSYSAYLFEDFDFTKQGALDGLFNTIGVSQNKQGKAQALSHASIFIANRPPEPPVKTKVPEPASIIGLGLVSGTMFMKRRRKSNPEL